MSGLTLQYLRCFLKANIIIGEPAPGTFRLLADFALLHQPALHDTVVRARSPHLSYSSFSPSSWVLYGKGEGVIEFQDKDVSLWQTFLDKWGIVTLDLISIGAAYLIYKSQLVKKLFVSDNPDQDWLAVTIFQTLLILWMVWGSLTFILVPMKWWTSSLVRIRGGIMSIEQPFRWKRRLREVKLSDITSVQTSVGSSSFHSFFSFGVWLKDGTKVTFLHCSGAPEANWVLELMSKAIVAGGGAATEPLLAAAATAATPESPAITIRTAPPAPPGSQTASTSNQSTT
jgi:hypothetical protein